MRGKAERAFGPECLTIFVYTRDDRARWLFIFALFFFDVGCFLPSRYHHAERQVLSIRKMACRLTIVRLTIFAYTREDRARWLFIFALQCIHILIRLDEASQDMYDVGFICVQVSHTYLT